MKERYKERKKERKIERKKEKKDKLFVYLYFISPNIALIRNLKSRQLRWVGHVARMGQSTDVNSSFVGRLEGKYLYRGLNAVSRIILK